MNPPPAEIGAPVAEVETPALVIDLDALDRNIAKMAEFFLPKPIKNVLRGRIEPKSRLSIMAEAPVAAK